MFRPLARIFPYGLLIASVLVVGIFGLQPDADTPVAAIFPPWWTSARMFDAAARADGLVVRLGAVGGILVMTSGTPGLVSRLYAAGAVLVLDAQALGACGRAL